jgi:[protein-PII] uridylyltransferase
LPHADERVQATRAEAQRLLALQGTGSEDVARIWADFPDESFLRFSAAQIAWQTAGIARADKLDPLVLIEPHGERGGTEVFVHAADRDGLFAAITAVLDRLRLSVLDARIVTSHSGMSLDTFLVLDADGRALRDAGQLARLERTLVQTLTNSPYGIEPVKRAAARSLRHFPIPVRVEFSAHPVRGRSQLALVCADRPGLLAAVAQLFRACRVRVHDARIATFGERVEDFFLISDENDAPLGAAACVDVRDALLQLLDNAVERAHG